ncbi:hypothetical protein ACG0Z4_23110 [Enterocloster aldenensis]
MIKQSSRDKGTLCGHLESAVICKAIYKTGGVGGDTGQNDYHNV